MELAGYLLPLLNALWWPFIRILALLSAAPVVGDILVPLPVRVLLALVLSFLMLPFSPGNAVVDPFSVLGIATTLEQAVIGGVLGLAMHFSMSVVNVLGYLVSSQIGFSMAQMNDPVNGTASDVVSGMLSLLAIIVFFAIDGHLVLTGVLATSFKAWPVGGAYGAVLLHTVALRAAWIFAAAMLLALPIVFSTLVVQLGFGLLNRVAPSLNLFSLGFSLTTLFGLMMLIQIVRFIPEHYIAMSNQVLELIDQQMKAAHG
ncbi:flagellar biosynthetic protein FliR [Massilia sp. P8910]|uniref:flagellar biosynthetic protein FliR n=1 Tax=Massilia antarctica TaxID=2765360 RepID=UPI0006BB968E|nr:MULTISPECIES: flagellar biosynthetic protein FliR [Massilia]MCE3606121.1 flagellar biosynthetic protein FliR [Massilia antarctica]MCY0913188.1 flagellar biosynthetic protein FliR [Massilia sp. H27-R4]CUI07790.1 Flagellar biosynthesis protein FliR [Janthinobacterium sp. CG23_2]CUU31576.1 Flagellar biosynthesis protein FliR [Janthinobacterium sp. CG23_2]